MDEIKQGQRHLTLEKELSLHDTEVHLPTDAETCDGLSGFEWLRQKLLKLGDRKEEIN